MKARTKRILAVSIAAVGLSAVGCVVVAHYLCVELTGENLFGEKYEFRGSQRAEIIECTLEWARAAPLPVSAQVTSATKGGSIFTRGSRITFTAQAADIEDWLRRSPGVQDAVVTTPSSGVRHFQIEPGGGAAFAEIIVDDAQRCVIVSGYWS